MILVIGSYALNCYQHIRQPRDLDLVMTWETLEANQAFFKISPSGPSHFSGTFNDIKLEISIATPNSTNADLLEVHKNQPIHLLNGLPVVYCTLDWLYALKLSHRYKKNSPHFYKTMQDIKIMRSLDAKIPDPTWYKRREKETLAKHPKLNQDKQTFFNTPGITYVYDHDSIHRAMALGDQPAYQYYLADNAQVWCDKNKWNLLSDEIKLNGVLEEALVLALERSQIPFNFKPNPIWSFRKALMKVCTSITSGWFREWAWEHHDQVLEKFHSLPLYTERFKEKLNQGVVHELGK